MRKGLLVLGMLAVTFVSAPGLEGQARATEFTTPTQTLTIPLTQTDWGPNSSSLAGLNPFAIQQFNSATYSQGNQVAVLTGVDLSLDYQFNNTISMRFDNVSTITVNATGNMRLTMPDQATNLVSPPSFTNTGTQASTPADVFSKFVTLPTATYTGTNSIAYNSDTSQSLVNQFNGNGTINLPVFATAQSSFTTSSGNGFGSSVTLARATIRLTYRYTLVPEPSSMILSGIGMAGLLWVGRNRTRIQPA